MPNKHKTVQCVHCGVSMRSDNVSKHITRMHQGKGMPEDNPRCQEIDEKKEDTNISRHGSGLWVEKVNRQLGYGLQPTDQNAISDKYVWREKGVQRNHNFLLPRDIRAIVIGKSGFGKTTLLTYLLLEPDMLDYDTLTICGRSLHQPEYKIMNAAFSQGWSKGQVNKLFEQQDRVLDEYGDPDNLIEQYEGKCKGGIDATFSDDPSAIPDPSQHDSVKTYSYSTISCWVHSLELKPTTHAVVTTTSTFSTLHNPTSAFLDKP